MIVDWMRLMMESMPQVASEWHFDLIVGAWDLGVDVPLHGAPHVVVAHAQKDAILAEGNSYIGLTYLELAAYSLLLHRPDLPGAGGVLAGAGGMLGRVLPDCRRELPADDGSTAASRRAPVLRGDDDRAPQDQVQPHTCPDRVQSDLALASLPENRG